MVIRLNPPVKTSYTVEDLWELSHRYPDKRFELVYGKLIETMPTGGKHGEVVVEITFLMRQHTKAHDLGRMTGAETGYILGYHPDTQKPIVRAPDVGFIRKDRLPDGLPEKYIPFAPDLAVEVVSPNDDKKDLADKIQQYLAAGTQLVWAVYPETQTIIIYTADHTQTLTSEETLTGSDVLPDFQIQVESLFAS